MRFVVYLAMMVVVALLVGFGLSYYALTEGRFFGTLQSGSWTAWPDIGTPDPNPYTRAHIARLGQLQLGQSEGLQFIADTDSDGEPLTRSCSYRLEGTTPLATFWTLVAVDEDGRNIALPDTPPVIRSSDLARGADGSIQLNIGTRLSPLNWLALSGSGPFTLELRLYDTASFTDTGSSTRMPTITRGACP
ncbi:hypothetical protein GCM10007989_26290 [Devosia pacifica]|uniref:DUF1214 domain-containing protein n=1 Tax=Devosia pacifica TaxID=1335967 RepID=A0A918SAE6_9HYPH|nr:DUF1214 domain-containing protein [Devosia pacifica]GHA29443.1 hypothetical protein GCM10007989_26290 [Devosia pacifica]